MQEPKIFGTIVKKNLADHKTPEEIASVLYVDFSTIQKIIANIETFWWQPVFWFVWKSVVN